MSVPTIAIVTTCRNDARFVGQALRSVLEGQDAPDEYVVVDGGSTDGTVEIIESEAQRLTWFGSERDSGQYDGIQRGFDRTTAEVMGWLNGNDLFTPWTLAVVRELFATFGEMEWLTTQRPLTVDEDGRAVACEYVGGFAQSSFRVGANLPGGRWFARAGIQQESTFWRRSLWERAGSRLQTDLQYAGDFELWLRFFAHAQLFSVDSPLAAHRVHADRKTATLDGYVEEALGTLRAAGYEHSGRGRSRIQRATFETLGRRPLRRLPRIVREPLLAAGLLHRVPTIVWRDGAWIPTDDFVV